MKRSTDFPDSVKANTVTPYRIIDTKTGEATIVFSKYEASFKLKRSAGYIVDCARDGTLIKKRYKVEKL